MVLVDSNVWIRTNRSPGDLLAKVALESLLEEGKAAFCGPVRLEALGAVRREFRAPLDAHFAVVPYLVMTEETWRHAVTLGRTLKDAANLTLPWSDMLIAAIAAHHRCRVFSFDDHFELLARHFGLRRYVPGPGGTFRRDGS
jgi:predicted nucleic acid-binding protein